MKKKPKRTPLEQQLLRELASTQAVRVGLPKSQCKGWSDTPLFKSAAEDRQTNLF